MSISNPGPGSTGSSAGFFSKLYEKAAQAATATSNFARSAANITTRIYHIATDTVIPATSQLIKGTANLATDLSSRAYHALVDTAIPAVKTTTRIAGQILFNYNKAVDSSDGVAQLDIDKGVKSKYSKVMPGVVKPFYDRFGADTMLHMAQFTDLAQKHIPGIAGSVINTICPETTRVDLQTLALGTVTYVADKVKKTMPDDDTQSRKDLAAGIARDIQPIAVTLHSTAEQTRKETKADWGHPSFLERYNELLAKSDLAHSIGSKEKFYTELADRLLERLENELPLQLEPHLRLVLEAASEGTEKIWPHKKRDLLASLLMELHEVITDPTQVKEWLTDILNQSSESLEEQYNDFLGKIDHASWWLPFHNFFTISSPQAPKADPSYDPAFGKSLMEILRALKPRAFGANVIGTYSRFAKGEIEKGEDFVSVLLRNSTGSSIEGLMAAKTDAWFSSALKIAKMNLLSKEGNLIDRPKFIPEEVWSEWSVTERLEACNKNSGRYQNYKKKHIKQVDAQLLESSKRLSKGIFRAGMIVEQFLPKQLDIAANPEKHGIIRVLSGSVAFIRQLPVIHFLVNCFYRLSILLRQLIADSSSRSTAFSIHSRLQEFLKTDSMNLMSMHMMERLLDRFELLAPKKKASAADETSSAMTPQIEPKIEPDLPDSKTPTSL